MATLIQQTLAHQNVRINTAANSAIVQLLSATVFPTRPVTYIKSTPDPNPLTLLAAPGDNIAGAPSYTLYTLGAVTIKPCPAGVDQSNNPIPAGWHVMCVSGPALPTAIFQMCWPGLVSPVATQTNVPVPFPITPYWWQVDIEVAAVSADIWVIARKNGSSIFSSPVVLPAGSVGPIAGPAGVTGIAISGQAGTGYTVGDQFTLPLAGVAATARGQVSAVGAGGVPTVVTLLYSGALYAVTPGVPVSGGTGSGLHVDITSIGGAAFSAGVSVAPGDTVDGQVTQLGSNAQGLTLQVFGH
jgi:hypothetical protein